MLRAKPTCPPSSLRSLQQTHALFVQLPRTRSRLRTWAAADPRGTSFVSSSPEGRPAPRKPSTMAAVPSGPRREPRAPRNPVVDAALVVASRLPWSLYEHPGAAALRANEDNSVFHRLQDYIKELGPALDWRFCKSIRWRSETLGLLDNYIKFERYLQQDARSNYFRQRTMRLLSQTSRQLHMVDAIYGNEPSYQQNARLFSHARFALRLRGRELGMRWDGLRQTFLWPDDRK